MASYRLVTGMVSVFEVGQKIVYKTGDMRLPYDGSWVAVCDVMDDGRKTRVYGYGNTRTEAEIAADLKAKNFEY